MKYGSTTKSFRANPGFRSGFGFCRLAAGLLLVSTLSCRRQSTDDLLEQAMTAAQAGDWSYARGYAQSALSRDRNSLDAQHLLGLSHYYMDEQSRAVRLLRQAAEQADDDFTAQFLYGWILCENRNFAEALAPLRKAFQLDREHRETTVLLARACLEQNLVEGAKYLRLLLAHTEFAERPEVFNALAILWINELEYGRAHAFFQQALRRDPDNPVVLQNLAVLHDVYLHDEPTALAYYRRCLSASQRFGDEVRQQQVRDRLLSLRRSRN